MSRRYGRKREAPKLLFSAEARDCVFATLLAPLRGAPLALSGLQREGGVLCASVLHADTSVVDTLVVRADRGAEILRTDSNGSQRLLLQAGCSA